MKKKICISIALILFLAIIWFGYELYKYNKPDGVFVVGQPLENTDIYIETLSFTIKKKSVFGCSQDTSDRLFEKASEILEGVNEMRLNILEDYSAPIHVNIVVDVSGDQVNVLFEGIGTEKVGGDDGMIHMETAFDYTVD